ncbi:MAG: glycosyltransferase family 4 protein [Bacteroidota bacterium]
MHIGVLSDPNNFHTRKWVKGLLSQGAKVTVFSFFEGEIEGATCIRIPPQRTLQGKITYFSYLHSYEDLREALYTHQIDVLNPINVTPYGVWGARTGFRPLVQIAMGADILEYPPTLEELELPTHRLYSSNRTQKLGPVQQAIFPFKWRTFRKNVAAALEAADLVTGDNLQLTEALEKWFQVPSDKIRLNRWGIEEKAFDVPPSQIAALRQKLQIRQWQRVILSPRGLKPVYNGDVILQAMELLLKRGVRDAHFIVLSAGYDVPKEQEAKALELATQFDNFTYLQELIPREEMMILWRMVDAFVITPMYDGYSNALSEGRFVGAIPIVNDIPAHRELMQHAYNGLVVESLAPDTLADMMRYALEHTDVLKERFTPVNQAWIHEHALLESNIQAFIQDLVELRFKQME